MSQLPTSLVTASVLSLPAALLPDAALKSSAVRRVLELPVFAGRAAEVVPIICFCHLSWSGVWQRPQQLLSRMAKTHPVLFVETTPADVAVSELHSRVAEGHPQVTVLQMRLPGARWSDGGWIDGERRRLLQQYCALHAPRYASPILWFNDPMAVVAFAGQCGERAIVYDCMDELTQFHGAPTELQARERELVLLADVIFCGGRKMRERRLPLNRNTHFFPTGVDNAHFGTAREASLAVDPAIARLPGKVLGYFGVIDERIDYELLTRLADASPEWSIAMVGPTAKIDPATLPQRPNLHWIGPKTYRELPAVTKGFAVCLMPFARNAATEYINPTKALEYMATARTVVSTAIDEVKLNFGTVCRVARTPEEFIQFCLEETAKPDRKRVQQGVALAAESTWEAIVAGMERQIQQVLAARVRPAVATTSVTFAGRVQTAG